MSAENPERLIKGYELAEVVTQIQVTNKQLETTNKQLAATSKIIENLADSVDTKPDRNELNDIRNELETEIKGLNRRYDKLLFAIITAVLALGVQFVTWIIGRIE